MKNMKWLRAGATLMLGVAVWFGVLAFEELVTTDLRWGLWAAAALLFAVAAELGRRGLGGWAPLLLCTPLIGLHALPVALDLPLYWPYAPLWAASAQLGWWLGRRPGAGPATATLLLGLALAAFGGWIIPRGLAAELNQYTDEPAPEIALTRLDGSPFPMQDLAGKVVVLDFFATWCLPCRAELPELQSVRRELVDREDIVILVVGDGDSGDTVAEVAAFAASSGLELPFVWDPGGQAHDAFGFWNIPALAVIDRQGRVRLKRVGYNPAETGFAETLKELLVAL